MKLMLLLPNIVLIAVSGINLSNELTAVEMGRNLAFIVLHLSVLIMCVVFMALIIKSMFTVVEQEETLYMQDTASYQRI